MCSGVPAMSAYCDGYSVKGSSGVSGGIFRKLIFKSFFLGEFFSWTEGNVEASY